MKNAELLNYLTSGYRLQQPPLFPDEAWPLVLRCWDLIPKNRPTFQEIEQAYHVLFTDLIEDFPITRDIGNVIDGAARRARRESVVEKEKARRWERKSKTQEDPTSANAVYFVGASNQNGKIKSDIAGIYVPPAVYVPPKTSNEPGHRATNNRTQTLSKVSRKEVDDETSI